MAQEDLLVLLTLQARDAATGIIHHVEAELHNLHGAARTSLAGSAGLSGLLSSLPGPAQIVAAAVVAVGTAVGAATKMPPDFERRLIGVITPDDDTDTAIAAISKPVCT